MHDYPAVRLADLHHDERGTTLMEMIVGMAIMAIFMSMFTGALLLMSNTTNKVEAIANSTGQLNQAFLQLDRSIRYATGISTITTATTTSDWHVEYERTINSVDTCSQLRIDNGQLQTRTWLPNSAGTGYTGLSGWTALASGITNSSPTATPAPFSVPAANASVSTAFQQLTISLVVASGTSTAATTMNSMTFTALNSSAASSAPVCQQVTVSQTS